MSNCVAQDAKAKSAARRGIARAIADGSPCLFSSACLIWIDRDGMYCQPAAHHTKPPRLWQQMECCVGNIQKEILFSVLVWSIRLGIWNATMWCQGHAEVPGRVREGVRGHVGSGRCTRDRIRTFGTSPTVSLHTGVQESAGPTRPAMGIACSSRRSPSRAYSNTPSKEARKQLYPFTASPRGDYHSSVQKNHTIPKHKLGLGWDLGRQNKSCMPFL